MQLGQPESLDALDQHYGGVGNVHTHFDHGRGHHDIRFPFLEAHHFVILGLGAHLPVHDAHLMVGRGKMALHGFVTFHKVLVVHLFGLGDERIDDISLSPFLQDLLEKVEDSETGGFGPMNRPYRLSSWREFIDHRNVQIPVKGHG